MNAIEFKAQTPTVSNNFYQILYINNLVIFGLSRFTLIMNDDKSSGDTTLTYILSPSKCLHPKRVCESNGFPESLDKISF